MARTSASSRVLTDHDEIRRWAGERGAKPARVRGTGDGDDVGIIRLDFPGYTGEDKLEPISWDDWFRKFDESGLALLVQDKTAKGQRSNFNKLVSRETVGISEGSGSSSSRSRNQQHRQGASREEFSREEEEEGYEVSANYSDDDIEPSEDMEDDVEIEINTEEEMEEDSDVEELRPGRVSGAGNSRNRKPQGRATGSKGTRSARSSATAKRTSPQMGRSRNERSIKARTPSSKRGQATGGSRSSAKKAPARAKSSGSRTSRGRSSSSRKRAA
jgi:hypothetical protein